MKVLLLLCILLVGSVSARLPRKPTDNPTSESSLESEQPKDSNLNSSSETSDDNNSSSVESDEDQLFSRPQNPFSLLERLFDMHLGSMRNIPKMPGTSVISIRPINPVYNPFGFYPEPTIRRPSILQSRFPFPANDPFDMSSTFPQFPHFPHLPSIAHPSMFDMDNEKVPEGYVKVNETILGPEGHQTIHTTYEKKNEEGPNQFYGIIVKIRPYKPNNGSTETAAKPTNPEDTKKQDDRRIAAENRPNNSEREVEESAINTAAEKPSDEKTKEVPTSTAASPEKSDTDAVASKADKEKSLSENEIPKSEEAPLITVNDNSKGNQ